MRTDTTDDFDAALEAADVPCTRTETSQFEATLREVVDQPAVGAPLDIDGVSLAEVDVDLSPTPRQLANAATGVTRVRAGIAEHGTFVIQSDEAGTEPVSLYPHKHVGVVRASDLHEDVESVASWLREEFATGRDSAILATGASATADMGKMVQGVHGPQTVHAVVLTDQ